MGKQPRKSHPLALRDQPFWSWWRSQNPRAATVWSDSRAWVKTLRRPIFLQIQLHSPPGKTALNHSIEWKYSDHDQEREVKISRLTTLVLVIFSAGIKRSQNSRISCTLSVISFPPSPSPDSRKQTKFRYFSWNKPNLDTFHSTMRFVDRNWKARI